MLRIETFCSDMRQPMHVYIRTIDCCISRNNLQKLSGTLLYLSLDHLQLDLLTNLKYRLAFYIMYTGRPLNPVNAIEAVVITISMSWGN